jgi:integrase
MTRIKRLTQRAAETAMPVEVEVLNPEVEVEARIAKALKRHGIGRDRRSRLAGIGQIGALASELERSPSLTAKRTRYLCDGHGLYLAISVGKTPGTVNRSWLWRWATGNVIISKNGKARREQKKIGLGSLETVSVDRARELAARYRQQVQDGLDPSIVKQQDRARHKIEQRQLHTLKQAVDEYTKRHGDAWSPKHLYHWRQSFSHLSTLLDLPVSKIDRVMVVKALEPLWADRSNTAMRLRGRLESVLSASEVWGWHNGENPASWSLLKHSFRPPTQLVQVKHHVALPWEEAPGFMAKLMATEGTKARALELVIRTAARTAEALTAVPEDFDLISDNPTWTVPAEKTKTGKKTGEVHIVPLSPATVACLRKIEMKPGQRIFPLYNRALWNFSKTIDERPSVHGWRRVWKSWSGDHGYSREVTEMQLQHRIGNTVENAYNYSTYLQARKKQLRDWSDFLDGRSHTA